MTRRLCVALLLGLCLAGCGSITVDEFAAGTPNVMRGVDQLPSSVTRKITLPSSSSSETTSLVSVSSPPSAIIFSLLPGSNLTYFPPSRPSLAFSGANRMTRDKYETYDQDCN